MKNILEKIWKFVNSRVFGYAVVFLTIIILLGMCNRNSNLKDDIDRQQNNIAVMNDTITTIKTKNGELQSSIGAYVANEKELKKLNSKLADEVSKQIGKVSSLNRIVFGLKQDVDELQKWKDEHPVNPPKPPTPVNDSTWDVPWTARYVYDTTNFDEYGGTTQIGLRGPLDLSKISVIHNETNLNYRNSQIGLVWGQEWVGKGRNKQLKVFARTNHPAFKSKLMDGYYVDPTKDEGHWLKGFGIGPNFTLGYDFLHNQPAVIVGVGIHYNFYKF